MSAHFRASIPREPPRRGPALRDVDGNPGLKSIHLHPSHNRRITIGIILSNLLIAIPATNNLAGQELRVGYGLISADSAGYLPAASAVFGFRNNSTLISEAGVPATRPTRLSRTYAVVRAYMDTGVAIANPNDNAASITVEVRTKDGDLINSVVLTLPGHQQTARFLSQIFGNAVKGMQGTVTVSSDLPVATVALRQRNSISGSLFTTLPMMDLEVLHPAGSLIFPHFACGGGYETELILINPGNDPISGTVAFYQQNGQPAKVISVNGIQQSQYQYSSIPAKGILSLTPSTDSSQTISGYAVSTLSTVGAAASGLAIFAQIINSSPVTEASVPATASTHRFRLFLNESAKRNSGLAIANPGKQEATLSVSLNSPSGPPLASGIVKIPAGGQIAKFVWQMLDGVEQEVPAILEVNSDIPVYPLTLRLTVNERNDALLTTLPVADLEAKPLLGSALFPQIALGDGWNTEVILIDSGIGDQNGSISFSRQDGSALFMADGSSRFSYQVSPGVGARFQTLRGSLISAANLNASAGTITTARDERYTFPAGTFRSATKVSLGGLTKDQVEDFLDNTFESLRLNYLSGFAIDTANASYLSPVRLSFADAYSLPSAAPVLIARVSPDVNGDGIPDLVLVDVGAAQAGRIESQSIATLPGILKDGSYLLLSTTPVAAVISGQVTESDGSAAVGVAVSSLEQPGIFSLTDASGRYTLVIPLPQTASGSSAPAQYAAAIPLTVHLVAAAPGMARIGLVTTSLPTVPGIIPVPTSIILKQGATGEYLRSLCASPDAALLDKFEEWTKRAQDAIEKLKIPALPYNPSSATLDCSQKTVQLSANLQSALTPEKTDAALGNLLASKITLTKASLFKICISRNIQIADFQIGSFAAQPTATSSNPAVASVGSSVVSGQNVVTPVQAVATGAGVTINGGILLLKLGFKLDYAVEACGQKDNCSLNVSVNDDLAMNIDRSLNPILLGPAAIAVNDLTACVPLPPPTIGVNPVSFAFAGDLAGSDPPGQSLVIKNTGQAGSKLNYLIQASASWLKASGPLTTLAAGESATLSISVAIAGLAAGVYSATITIIDSKATNSPVNVPVTLTIASGTRSIQANPSSFAFSALQGDSNPSAQTLALTSTGGSLAWSGSASDSWLNIAPAGGSTPASASVSVKSTGLQAGTYTGRITLTAPGASNSPLVVPVTLSINGPLTFTVPSPLPPAQIRTSYQFSFCQGARPNEPCGGTSNPASSPSGGKPPYQFKLGSGAGLPPSGLALDVNGLLSGTPTGLGTQTFSVCAVDQAGSQACRTVSLTVSDATGGYSGPFSGWTTDSKSLSPFCIMKHTLSGTLNLKVSGSGTLADPYTGTVSGDGTDVLTVVAGANCYGDTIKSQTTGTVSGSLGTVQAVAYASGGGTTVKLEFSNGIISGNTLTGTLILTNEFFDAPITLTVTLTKTP